MISNIKRKTDLKGSNMNLAMLLNALIPFWYQGPGFLNYIEVYLVPSSLKYALLLND